MEKVVILFVIVGFCMNLNLLLTPQQVETSDLDRLIEVYRQQQLPLQGIVIEGWLPIHDEKSVRRYLEYHFDLPKGENSIESCWTDGSSQKIYLSQRRNMVIEFQMITENIDLAREQYRLWTQLSRFYAGNQPVGITLLSRLNEPLEAKTCQLLADELAGDMQTTPGEAVQGVHYQSYVWNTSQLQHRLKISGQAVNCNLAFVQQEDQTSIYLGSPVIYQQY